MADPPTSDPDSPWHAHIYYSAAQRVAATALRDRLGRLTEAVLFVGRMMDEGVGPHPVPQYEIHFREAALPEIVPILEASGLNILVHPLTTDDLADHTTLARWLGEPVALDVTALDPPGVNQGLARFGISDF
jgi:aromatic ring-cleaving dioxygenase